jgi:branched-chain amino acid transport system substrate-binding protein
MIVYFGIYFMFDSSAITKVQSVILITVIVVATVSSTAYVLLSREDQPSDTIKIGVCADLDGSSGKIVWQEVVLAVEQINAEGGVLGCDFEVVAVDDDSESGSYDVAFATNALTRLITVDKADFIINSGSGGFSPTYQEIIFQHEKILFDGYATGDELTKRVLDDYERYKYYFRAGIPNATSATNGVVDSFLVFKEYTGFNNAALIAHDIPGVADRQEKYVASLNEKGFDVVYTTRIPLDTIDFSSYFAAAEAAGAELAYCTIVTPAGLSFVNEYAIRQSPMVLWGVISSISVNTGWELTDGKCEFISPNMFPTAAGYPLTSNTLPFREAYLERWNTISVGGGPFYDVVRFILPDAIERAGTIESNKVIEALESTSIETCLARRFVFTSDHDIFIGEAGPNRPEEDYFLIVSFQWQDGELVPVYPKRIMEEEGVTYKLPSWLEP